MPSHFVVNCPQCSRQLRLPADVLTKVVKCPLCQMEFETAERANGTVVGFAPGSAPPTEPPSAVPRLSLDDDDGPARPYPVADDDRPDDRDRRRRDDPRRDDRRRDERDDRRRDERDERRPPRRWDDEDRRPPRRERERRPEDDGRDRGTVFAVLVHSDPHDKLSGRFSAAVDRSGLRLWRGAGRVLAVERGQKLRQLDGARLAVPIEGRDVELSVIDVNGRSLILAEQILALFAGERDDVELPRPKRKPAGPVVWMPLLALGIPTLALAYGNSIGGVGGAVGWSILALVAMLVCWLWVRVASWSVVARVFLGGGTLALAYAILGIGFANDERTLPAVKEWQTFSPPDGGFTASLPGEPTPSAWVHDRMRGLALRTYEVRHEPSGTTFIAGVGEFKPDNFNPQDQEGRFGVARDLVRVNSEGIANNVWQPETTNLPSPQQGTSIRELRFAHFAWGGNAANGQPEAAVARVVLRGNRVMILCVQGPRSLTRYHPEVRRFFDSGKLDDADDTELLGRGGRVLAAGTSFIWADFTKDGETTAAVSDAGVLYFWDRANKTVRPAQDLQLRGEPVAAAAFSPAGDRLAVAGLLGSLLVVDVKTGAVNWLANRVGQPGPWQGCVAWSPDGKTLATGNEDRQRGGGNVTFFDSDGRRPQRKWQGAGASVGALSYSPDGRTVVAADVNRVLYVLDAGDSRALFSRNPAHGGPGFQVQGEARQLRYALRGLAFSPDAQSFVTTGNDQIVRWWDAGTALTVRTSAVNSAGCAVAFSRTGKLVAVGGSNGEVVVFDSLAATRGLLRQPDPPFGQFGQMNQAVNVRGLGFHGDRLVVATSQRVELYTVSARVTVKPDDMVPLAAVVPPPKNLRAIKPGYEMVSLAVCGNGSRFTVTPKQTPAPAFVFGEARPDAPSGTIDRGFGSPGTALSPTGTLSAVARADRIDVYEVATNKLSRTWKFGETLGRAGSEVAFSPDGRRVAVGQGRDGHGEVQIHRPDGPPRVFSVPAVPSALAFSPDGLTLAVVSGIDKQVRLFDSQTGREYARLKGHAAAVKALAYSPDGATLASGDDAGGVLLFDTAKCRLRHRLAGLDGPISGVSFSPDKLVAAGDRKGKVRVWDAPSGKALLPLEHAEEVVGLGFGPGGNSLLVGTTSLVNVWDLREVEELKKRPPPAAVDLDKSTPPEVPDVQAIARLEPHLCRVVDAEAGVLLAFTRDKLCLHYAYPELTLKGSHHVGEIVFRAALDAKAGKLYAATTDAGSLARGLSPMGKGPVCVYDVKDVLADKARGGRLARLASVDNDGATVHSLALAPDRATAVFVTTKTTEAGSRVQRFDAKTYKAGEPLSVSGVPTGMRLSPDGKTAYLFGRDEGARGFVLPIDLAAFTAGKPTSLASVPFDAAVTDDEVALVLSAEAKVSFLDRKASPMTSRREWRSVFGMVALRTAGGRAYVWQTDLRRRVTAFDLAGQGRDQDAKSLFLLPSDADRSAFDHDATADGKYLISTAGEVLRLGDAALRLPAAAKQEKEPRSQLKPAGTWKAAHDARVLSLAWSSKGDRLATGGADRWLTVRSSAGEVERTLRCEAAVGSVAWSRDDRRLAAAAGDAAYFLSPAGEPNPLRPEPRAAVSGVAFGKAGLVATGRELIAAEATDFTVRGTRALGSKSPLTGVAAGADLAAAGRDDGQVTLYESGAELKEGATLKAHDGEARCVAVGPDGKVVVSGGADGKAVVFDVAAAKQRHLLDHGAVVLGVAVACDGKSVATAGLDGFVRLWDAETGKQVAEAQGDGVAANAVAFSPDGKELAVAVGREVRRYDTSAAVGKPVVAVPAVPAKELLVGRFADAAFDVKGGQMFAVSTVGVLKRLSYPQLEDAGTHRLEGKWTATKVAYDAESKTLSVLRYKKTKRVDAVVYLDPDLYLFDVSKLKPGGFELVKPVRSSRLADEVAEVASFSPDGKKLFAVDVKSNKLYRYSAATGKMEREADVPAGATGAFLTPDGSTVWVATSDQKGRGKLTSFSADELKQKQTSVVAMTPTLLAASDAGKLCVSGGASDGEFLLTVLDAQDGFRQSYQARTKAQTYPVLSADQRGVFLASSGDGETSLGALPLRDGIVRPTEFGRGPGTALVTARALKVSPDGAFLFFNANGQAIRLKK